MNKTEILVTCAMCVGTILINLWTMHRAERVEERIKRRLAEEQLLCPLCGDHYQQTDCTSTSRL